MRSGGQGRPESRLPPDAAAGGLETLSLPRCDGTGAVPRGVRIGLLAVPGPGPSRPLRPRLAMVPGLSRTQSRPVPRATPPAPPDEGGDLLSVDRSAPRPLAERRRPRPPGGMVGPPPRP